MALPKISLFKSSALLVITLAHSGLLYWLYHFHPNDRFVAHAAMQWPREHITQITFITRPKPKPQQVQHPNLQADRTPQRAAANTATGLQVEFKEKAATAMPSHANTHKDLPALNLSLPEATLDFSPKPRDLMERARNPIEYQATRFNDRYKPSGNAVDSLKWKSKTFNLITGLFGGNMKICTDEDRKNRRPECVPDAYQPEE